MKRQLIITDRFDLSMIEPKVTIELADFDDIYHLQDWVMCCKDHGIDFLSRCKPENLSKIEKILRLDLKDNIDKTPIVQDRIPVLILDLSSGRYFLARFKSKV